MLRAGSDDESSEGEKKKKKKKDKKKKKKSSSRLNPDHEDPFYIGGGHVRPGDVSVDDVPVVRLSKKELRSKDKKKKKKSRKVGRADVYVEDSLPDGVSDDEGKRRVAASSSICGRCPGVESVRASASTRPRRRRDAVPRHAGRRRTRRRSSPPSPRTRTPTPWTCRRST
jgi:hypothetical protein